VIDCDERPGHRLLGARSEHHWLRLCHGRLGHLFPYLPNQPGYHKRVKKAAPLLAAVTGHLARQSPCWYDPVRLIDATPGAVRHLAGDRPPRRAGRAGALWILRGALALVLGAEAVHDHHPGRDAGGVVPGRSSLGEREAAAELLAHAARTGALRPGLTLIGDKGFAGRSSRAWSPPGTGCGWSGRTAATRRPGTGPSAGSGSGSSRSTTPSRASWTWNGMAAGPPRASTPASPSSCWPWPSASGTTGPRRTRQAVTDRLRQLNP